MWRGKVQLKCGDGRKLLTWLLWGAPLSEGRAPIAYLIGRGLAPLLLTRLAGGSRPLLGGLVIFLHLLGAAKS